MKTLLLSIVLVAVTVDAATLKAGPSGDIVQATVENLMLTVRWNNNFTAVAVLIDKEDCIFPGKFLLDEESEVLVTGCTTANEEIAVQFQSRKFGDYIFTVTKEGKIKQVENDVDEYEELVFISEDYFGVGTEENGRVKREDEDYYEDFYFLSDDLEILPDLDDYEIDDELQPKEVELQLTVYLDLDFKKLHGRKAKTRARQIVVQAGLLMKHSSLATKISLVANNRYHFSNQHLGFSNKEIASNDFYKKFPDVLKSPYSVDGGHPIAHVYMTVADGGFAKGVALGGSMCAPLDARQGKPRAIIVWQDVATSGATLAHELGHVLGMYHDFSARSGRTSSTCADRKTKGQFILNYGNNPRRTTWSDCSNEDFKEYYFKQRFARDDKFCLKEIGNTEDAVESSCSPSEFQCGPGGRCIPSSQRCDGLKRHCPGGVDELGCPFDPFL